LELGKEINFEKTYDSLALIDFSVKLKINIFLENISEDKSECEISVFGIMDPETLNYDLLRKLASKELGIDTLTAYNYYVEIFYVVNIPTGFIKNMDIEITEKFNDTLIYKFDQFASDHL
jgi:hypothetical protein